jgi:hypothetical protein
MIPCDQDGPVSLTDVLKDGWGDDDIFGSATDTTCTGGVDPAASHCRDVVGEPSPGIAESPVQRVQAGQAKS